VLEGEPAPEPPPAPEEGASILVGLSLVGGAAAVALVALFRRRLAPERLRAAVHGSAGRGLQGLRAVHSGDVDDYVAWLTLGVAILGGAFAVTMT
jgi:hypothetical protein